jgi:hypothetical protein
MHLSKSQAIAWLKTRFIYILNVPKIRCMFPTYTSTSTRHLHIHEFNREQWRELRAGDNCGDAGLRLHDYSRIIPGSRRNPAERVRNLHASETSNFGEREVKNSDWYEIHTCTWARAAGAWESREMTPSNRPRLVNARILGTTAYNNDPIIAVCALVKLTIGKG